MPGLCKKSEYNKRATFFNIYRYGWVLICFDAPEKSIRTLSPISIWIPRPVFFFSVMVRHSEADAIMLPETVDFPGTVHFSVKPKIIITSICLVRAKDHLYRLFHLNPVPPVKEGILPSEISVAFPALGKHFPCSIPEIFQSPQGFHTCSPK